MDDLWPNKSKDRRAKPKIGNQILKQMTRYARSNQKEKKKKEASKQIQVFDPKSEEQEAKHIISQTREQKWRLTNESLENN